MSKTDKVTICILAHNSAMTIRETIESALDQNYDNLEVVVMENGSKDNTINIVKDYKDVIIYSVPELSGMAANMERCASLDTDIIVFMCDDDIFTSKEVIDDIVWAFLLFHGSKPIGHISRYYHQFLDGDRTPIRANRSKNVYRLADNASGLAFRKDALVGIKIKEEPFIEAGSLVASVLKSWDYAILPYDTVAVRVGGNASQTMFPYRKAPTERWHSIIGNQDFFEDVSIGFIQIKIYGTYRILLREMFFVIKLNPGILKRLDFWVFASLALFMPRFLLKKMVYLYKKYIGKLVTKSINHDILED